MRRNPIDILLDKSEFRCTICNAKMGECDCWEEVICFHDKPPYHRPGLPGLTLCGHLPWTEVPEIGGKMIRIHAPREPKTRLCRNCFSDDERFARMAEPPRSGAPSSSSPKETP